MSLVRLVQYSLVLFNCIFFHFIEQINDDDDDDDDLYVYLLLFSCVLTTYNKQP